MTRSSQPHAATDEPGNGGKIAREIQDDQICRGALFWEDLRDRVDLATGGELDCIQLDIVTDIVAKHLRIATTGWAGKEARP